MWNLGGMGVLSCMTAGIGVSVCVLILVVVLVLVWMWVVLTVCVVVGALAVLLAMVVATMVGMLVEAGCVGVVFESSGGGGGAGGFWGWLFGVDGEWLCGVGMRGGHFATF